MSVIFFCLFVGFVSYNLIIYSVSDVFRGSVGVQKWKKVASLSERITSEITTVGVLVKKGEKIAENDRTYVLNDEPDGYYSLVLNNVYCSAELSIKVEEIMKERKVNNFFLQSDDGQRFPVSLETFVNHIKQTNIRCLTVDFYTGSDYSKISFLEPDKSFQDNWSFFEKSPIKTAIYFLEMVFVVLAFSVALFAGIAVLYYKIILYIIYGNKKKEI